MDMALEKVNVDYLLVYLEFLVLNSYNHGYIANQLAGIKATFVMYALPTAIFDDDRVRYFMRSLRLESPLRVTLHSVIDIPLLSKIVAQCDSMAMGQVFKAMYLLGFFSFLRLSNLVPRSITTFSYFPSC